MSDWVEIYAVRNGKRTDAMQLAGGCLVRTVVHNQSESSVFIPNSVIVDSQVIRKPTRLQISESQNILMSEVAAISKRPDALIFTLKCGKEITTTENVDEVLVAFMQAAP